MFTLAWSRLWTARPTTRAAQMRGAAVHGEPLVGVIATGHAALRATALGDHPWAVVAIWLGTLVVTASALVQIVRRVDGNTWVIARSLLAIQVVGLACLTHASLRHELETWFPAMAITAAFVLGARAGALPVVAGVTWFAGVVAALEGAGTATIRAGIVLVGALFAAAIGDVVTSSIEEAEHEAARAEQHRLREAQLRALIESAPLGIVLHQRGTGPAGTFVNSQGLELTGLTLEEVTTVGFGRVIHPDDLDVFSTARRMMGTGDAATFRLRVVPGDEVRYLEVTVFPVIGDDGVRLGTVAILRDISAELLQRRELERFRAVADATTDLVGMASPDASVLYLNRVARAFMGVDHDAPLAGVDLFEMVPPEHQETLIGEAYPVLMRGGVWQGELDLVSPRDGRRVPMSAVAVGLRDDEGRTEAFAVTYRDVTERQELEEHLAHAAAHDVLTGLPNREQLFAELERRRFAHEPIAVLFCDLDDFKLVNDSLGHSVGDRLLVELAGRLRRSSRDGDVVGRLGGDEFLLICRDVADEQEARAVAARVLSVVHEPIDIDGRRHIVSVSIGIAMCLDGQRRAGELIQEADIAMYRAKHLGRRRAEVFDEAMRTEVVERLEMERALRVAIEHEQLVLHFQPIIHVADGRVSGMEALVRWNHPERGLLGPLTFLGAAESAGLAGRLSEWVMRSAAQATALMREVMPDIRVGVNISAIDLASDEVVDQLVRAAGEAGVPTSALVVEVTEHTLMSDVEDARDRLEALRQLGIGVAVDDFGTGYSNLALLRKMPVDFLKIDRTFVDGLGSEPGDTQLVRMVLSLAHELGLEVIAEGVETEQQEAELVRLGCRHAQGYHFARPVELPAALALLRERRHLALSS